MNVDIQSPDFWIEQWNHSLEQSVWSQTNGYTSHHTWNRMAPEYGKETTRKVTTANNPETMIQILRDRGLFHEGIRVLDVGCGTGRMAIPFAEQGGHVTAVDFSDGMLERLRNAIPQGIAKRIEILQADWDKIVLPEQEWETSFDLVFAAMTPAIRTPESFLKLHRASRLGCCFQGWAGKREDPLLEGLWKHLLKTPMPSMAWDLTLAFNLLRTMGFSPTMEFQQVGWDRNQPVDKAADFFVDFFRERLPNSKGELRERITAYLDQKAEEGQVRRKTVGQTGVMTWSVL